MDKIVVSLVGAGLVGLIYWFFFGKKLSFTKTSEGEGNFDQIDILVNGGYKPENIKIRRGRTTKLFFKRTDPSACLEEIIIPDFKVKKFLPLNQKVEIDLTPEKTGEYGFHCGMNMFHGKIIVS